jgi:hypothetical protein
VRSIRSSIIVLQLTARSASRSRCLGPEASAVINGRLISVSDLRGQLDLGLLGGLLEALEHHLVLDTSRPVSLLNSPLR